MKITKFDVTDHLDNEDVIAEYLAAAMEDPDPDIFLAALGDVAKARGMAQLAKDSGLGRESLYKTLTPAEFPGADYRFFYGKSRYSLTERARRNPRS
ncbi:MAG: putative addiction module antidote protein [Deltaproteobacteria bacterium]|jgi:probable addiction module antidote protein|nr:putative addiction module antidote protein [Deltaproteobacteria bacterium]